MKKTILAIALTAALAGAAVAAPKSAIAADVENIKVLTAVDLLNALTMLGQSHEELVGQGQSQKVIQVPYALSADTVWSFTDNITALRKVAVAYDETRKALIAQAEAKNGGPLKADKEAVLDSSNNVVVAAVPSKAQRDLNEAIEKVFNSERPVAKLFRIKRGDLCLGGKTTPNAPDCPKDANGKDAANKIAPAVISSLAPILD